MDELLKKKLKSEAQQLTPISWIGKKGFTDEVKDEIKKLLKRRKLMKVKILKSFIDEHNVDKKTIGETIAEAVGAELIQKIGFIVVLYKKPLSRDLKFKKTL
ncbi:YhbY family RNA-binding protein [Candidatus Woesearchaeota archaeon]|nr:YhbY family RNA-binding protein [Candidatus Woesearchaeota archaeon]